MKLAKMKKVSEKVSASNGVLHRIHVLVVESFGAYRMKNGEVYHFHPREVGRSVTLISSMNKPLDQVISFQ